MNQTTPSHQIQPEINQAPEYQAQVAVPVVPLMGCVDEQQQDHDDDTSEEGREAIDQTRIAAEDKMIEVHDEACSPMPKEIYLHDFCCQTEIESPKPEPKTLRFDWLIIEFWR